MSAFQGVYFLSQAARLLFPFSLLFLYPFAKRVGVLLGLRLIAASYFIPRLPVTSMATQRNTYQYCLRACA